jgi:hypothetical protein
MSLSAAVIDALVATGVTVEQLAAAMKAELAEAEKRKTEKRAKDAARQRKSRASRGVTVTPSDSRDRFPNEVSSNPSEDVEDTGEASPHSARAPAQPVSKAKDVWNEAAVIAGWPTVSDLNSTRTRGVSGRLRKHGPEGWIAAINRARTSPYLGHDPPSWFTFDWLIKSTNFLKVIEGNYDRRHTDDRGSGGRMGGPRPDPTLAIVRAAMQAQREDGGDYRETRPALPASQLS